MCLPQNRPFQKTQLNTTGTSVPVSCLVARGKDAINTITQKEETLRDS